jgi:hypothetical protein
MKEDELLEGRQPLCINHITANPIDIAEIGRGLDKAL